MATDTEVKRDVGAATEAARKHWKALSDAFQRTQEASHMLFLLAKEAWGEYQRTEADGEDGTNEAARKRWKALSDTFQRTSDASHMLFLLANEAWDEYQRIKADAESGAKGVGRE